MSAEVGLQVQQALQQIHRLLQIISQCYFIRKMDHVSGTSKCLQSCRTSRIFSEIVCFLAWSLASIIASQIIAMILKRALLCQGVIWSELRMKLLSVLNLMILGLEVSRLVSFLKTLAAMPCIFESIWQAEDHLTSFPRIFQSQSLICWEVEYLAQSLQKEAQTYSGQFLLQHFPGCRVLEILDLSRWIMSSYAIAYVGLGNLAGKSTSIYLACFLILSQKESSQTLRGASMCLAITGSDLSYLYSVMLTSIDSGCFQIFKPIPQNLTIENYPIFYFLMNIYSKRLLNAANFLSLLGCFAFSIRQQASSLMSSTFSIQALLRYCKSWRVFWTYRKISPRMYCSLQQNLSNIMGKCFPRWHNYKKSFQLLNMAMISFPYSLSIPVDISAYSFSLISWYSCVGSCLGGLPRLPVFILFCLPRCSFSLEQHIFPRIEGRG